MWRDKQFLGRLGNKALENKIGAQALDVFGYQLDIFVDNVEDEYSERFNRYAEVYLLR